MSTSNNNRSNISSIKQTNESVPQEVRELYNKPTNSRRKIWKQKPDPSTNRIVNYFQKKNQERSLTFEGNRQPAMNVNLTTHNSIASINENEEFKKSQIAASGAKATALELNSFLQQNNVNHTELLKLNTKMVLQMHEAHEKLSSAMINRDKEITTQFASRLNEATTYIANEISSMRKEVEEIKSNDEVEKLATINACKQDLKKLWIRFTYLDDINQYREERNPPKVVKEILNQLNINLNKIMWPIESASFQTKKFSRNEVPETALECTFVNSTIANRVKSSIINFNTQLEICGKTNLIRYRVATDWSYQVRRILKYCNEMKRCGTLNKVMVTNEGIRVLHDKIYKSYSLNKANSQQLNDVHMNENPISITSSVVNSIRQLDRLRAEIKDYNYHASVIEVYNEEYYEKTLEERIKMRQELEEEIAEDNEDQMERTVSECSFSSVKEK